MSTSQLRVAMCSLLPESNAATRTFCQEPIALLARHGCRAKFFPPSGPTAYRALGLRQGRLRRLASALYWYALVLPRRLVQLPAILAQDVVFIQRGMLRAQSFPVLEAVVAVWARLTGRVVVCHYDDALYAGGRSRRHQLRFRLADWVLTGNREIADYVRLSNARVRRWEAGVDVHRYAVRAHTRSDHVVIGWAGTLPGDHLPSIETALAAVADEHPVVVKVVSGTPYRSPALGRHLVWEQWRPERRFDLFADFDIGVMPLLDTQYNRAKEAYKVKEYMAAGVPVVAADVGHNREVVAHGVTGFLARSDTDWVRWLRELVADAELRRRMGAAGRTTVAARYDLPDRVAELAAFLHEVSAGRHEPSGGRPTGTPVSVTDQGALPR